MDKIEKLLKDSNIVNIMNAVANRYSRSIDRDEIESIKMITLWKCRDKYDPTRGAKFTSYLYQQLSFAFKNHYDMRENAKKLMEINRDKFTHKKMTEKLGKIFDEHVNISKNVQVKLPELTKKKTKVKLPKLTKLK